MENFGKKLVDLRKQRGISQEQLAIDLHVSQSTISNYELGVTKPDTDILKKICDYFNIPITYMFSDEKIIFHTVENHSGNSGYMINSTLNTYTDKLIELYELRLREKEELITFFRKEIEKHANK
ncbi:MAG: helix-turn-helix domain-containing protein [Bacteroidales bacterium]|jgi:transcriptional regulator with XRE-family HTH domain|nr:helix-turn-helix domain-containing protein [Bacteroidales bacterium]